MVGPVPGRRIVSGTDPEQDRQVDRFRAAGREATLWGVETLTRRCLLGGGLALTALCLTTGCDRPPPWRRPARVPRVGYLGVGTSGPNALLLAAFQQGLRDLGYVEGQNLLIEYRFVDGRLALAPALAAELVALDVDLIVTTGIESSVAARDATAAIPIVGFLGQDPVGTGLVASLARPGGNVTGVTPLGGGWPGKLIQLLKDAFPDVETAAVLWNASNPVKAADAREIAEVAPSVGVRWRSVEVRADGDFEEAFGAIAASRADALVVLQDTLMAGNAARVVAFALGQRLRAIYQTRLYTDAGGLMSYGVDSVERYRRMAAYVDKVLKGARPADLPVEQPTAVDFVVNLAAARAIGVTIPPSVLARATEVLQ
jgi:putative ABC transport system substrate-binding protein